MAKIDKEALKKHRFWIGLGVFVAVWLIGIIVVEVSGDTSKQKAWSDAKTGIEGAKSKGPKTVKFQEPWNEHGSKFRVIKDKVWYRSWREQEKMYTWPDGMYVVDGHEPYFIDDEFGKPADVSVNNRARYRTDLYAPQIDALRYYVNPVEFNEGFDKVVPKVTLDRSRAPTREEIWLVQEDLWVRREMLAIVRNTIDDIARFHEEEPDPKKAKEEKLPEGILGQRVFTNANWQLKLLFAKADRGPGWVISPKSTIKNVSASKKTQPLALPGSNAGLPFRLIQGGGGYDMYVSGEPMPFGKEMPLPKTYSTDPVNLKEKFEIEQLMSWEICPIRRIDHLALSAQSHRTVTTALKIRDDLKALDPEAKDDAPAAAAGSSGGNAPAMGGSSSPGGGPKGMSQGSGGGSGGSAAAEDLTPVNKINRARYLHVTPQCRHLPIAMRIILDQSHINDFLAAVANSRLRIQTTQVEFQYARDVKRNTDAPPASGPGGPAGPTGSGPGGAGLGGSGSGKPGGPAAPMSGSSGGRPGGPAGPVGGSGSGPTMGSGGGSPRGLGGMGFGQGFSAGGRSGGFRPPVGGSGPSGMGGGEAAGKALGVKDNAQLVELTVYGIATLYERFDNRPKSKPGATLPPAPAK